MSEVGVVIVAAGYGSFREVGGNPYPKVLEPLDTDGDRLVITAVMEATAQSGCSPQILVLNGRDGDLICRTLVSCGHGGFHVVRQPWRLGAADAIARAIPVLEAVEAEDFLVVYGDMPLWRPETMRELVRQHQESNAMLSMVSISIEAADHPAVLEKYGRVLRDAHGRIVGVVEPHDASVQQLAETRRVNPSLWVFKRWWFAANLHLIQPRSKGDGFPPEFHTPNLVAIAASVGAPITEMPLEQKEEALGINTVAELEEVRAIVAR